MNELQISQFKTEDIDYDKIIGQKIHEFSRQRVKMLENKSAATYLINGKVVLCIGAIPLHPQCCEAWMLLFEDARPFMKTTLELVKRYLHRLKQTYCRVQATVENTPENTRFVEWLGFEKEGILRKWGVNQEDHVSYSIVRDACQS
jgi:hypothetical protein